MATVTTLTVDDLDEMDLSDGRYELIDGELVEATPVGSEQGRIGARSTRSILESCRPEQPG